jgi:hypothetical protein
VKDLNMMVPELCAAYKAFASEGKSAREVAAVVDECCDLLGRFVAPDSYIPFLLPRIRGELEVRACLQACLLISESVFFF